MPCFNLNKSNFNKDNVKQYKVVSNILKNSNEPPHGNHLVHCWNCVYVLNWIMTVVVPSVGKKHISSLMCIQLILVYNCFIKGWKTMMKKLFSILIYK